MYLNLFKEPMKCPLKFWHNLFEKGFNVLSFGYYYLFYFIKKDYKFLKPNFSEN